jgi:Flp pilus assembly protein TadG
MGIAKRNGPVAIVGRRGQALVELALVTMMLMFLVAGTLDLGRAWYSSISIDSAAREGALEAAIDPGSFQAGQPCDPVTNRIMCRVIGAAAGSNVTISPADVSVTCDPSPCPASPTWGDTVTVTVASHFGLITPILSLVTGQDLVIRASATSQLIIAP